MAEHVLRHQAQDGVLDTDLDRLVHVRYWTVEIGKAVARGEPVPRDDLERLAAAAIHWAIALPDQED